MNYRWILAAALVAAAAGVGAAQQSAIQTLEQWAGEKVRSTPARGIPIPIPIPVPVPVPPGREPRDHGREEAYRTCDRASWQMDRSRCFEIVDRAWYFERHAAWVCGSLSSRGIPACIESIADKWYERWEIDRCSGQRRDWGVVECFRHSGRHRR